MNDPAKFLDEGATEAELAILRAGFAEEPPPNGRERLSALLGLSAGLTAPAAAAGSKAAAGSSLKAFAGIGAAKWILIATLCAGGGLVAYSQRSRSPGAPSGAPVERPPPSEPPISNAALAGPAPAEAPASEPTAREPAIKARGGAPRSEPSAHAASKSIGVEIEELDGVRRSLRAHAPEEALRALDSYEKENPGGALRQEAALLRIEALAATGNAAAARQIAERFLRDNPKTPHRKRISALVGDVP